jgi:putative endonuclease
LGDEEPPGSSRGQRPRQAPKIRSNDQREWQSPPLSASLRCSRRRLARRSFDLRKEVETKPAKTTALATPPRRAKEKQHLMRYCVYILESQSFPDRFYTGFTQDLRKRLEYHNAGTVPATKPYVPWTIKTYVSFSDEQSARDFERYLKTHSGRAFAKKRL